MRAFLVSLLVALPLTAQVREAIEVRVIELEATVLDRSGKPVEGLTENDFRVTAGKREVPITNFFAVRDGEIAEKPAAGKRATSIPTSLPTKSNETSSLSWCAKRFLI